MMSASGIFRITTTQRTRNSRFQVRLQNSQRRRTTSRNGWCSTTIVRSRSSSERFPTATCWGWQRRIFSSLLIHSLEAKQNALQHIAPVLITWLSLSSPQKKFSINSQVEDRISPPSGTSQKSCVTRIPLRSNQFSCLDAARTTTKTDCPITPTLYQPINHTIHLIRYKLIPQTIT